MARHRFFLLGLTGLALVVQGCTATRTHQRTPRPTFAQAAPASSTESWASVMPMPGVEQDSTALARRDVALGLPPPGFTSVSGSWRQNERPSIDRYWLVPLPRSPRTLLFFTSPAQRERRAPRVPYGAHPWHTAW
ncbi:hypothetical protein AY599_27745 [Leptolyngbya valderiana BDU 20041]|nr:hypothetical protein AY599_27745 [Leptolyngbya valderiana BDU 20041]